MHSLGVLFTISTLFSSSFAVCLLDDLRCCLTEFSNFVSPTGISLSEEKVASVCTLREESLECMNLFLDQCSKNSTDEEALEGLVNKTSSYINTICPPASDFMTKLKANEECILNSSTSFHTCYNKTVVPQSNEKLDECCGYKTLRNCAVQAVENHCGASASQLVHEEVVNINGAVVEWACSDLFKDCKNSAVMLATSAFFVLYKIALLKFLL